MQRDLFVFRDLPLLILRLGAAVDLRIAERVGEEDVVFEAIAVLVCKVFSEVATRMLHFAERML